MLALERTVGYYKDLIALGAFAIALAAALFMAIPKTVIIAGLVCCIIIDGAFTLYPNWHCQSVGKNVATKMLIIQCVMVVCIIAYVMFYFWKK